MAEEVGNFPLDQGNTSALRALEQSREEVGRPRRLDDAEKDLRDPERVRRDAEARRNDSSRPQRIEDRVDISQNALDQNQATESNRTETQTQEARQESIQSQAVAQRRDEFDNSLQQNQNQPTPSNNGDVAQASGPGISDPEESLNEGFQLGNTQTNPNRTEEFSTRNQIDNPREAAQVASEQAASAATDQAAQTGANIAGSGNIDNAPERQNQLIQQRIDSNNSEVAGTAEVVVQQSQLSDTGANVTERRAEQRAADAEQAARNEPPLDIPASNVDPVEQPRDPLQEAQDTNPLRAPGPSAIRDEPDATAIETERGQNVSSLI